MHPKWCPFTSFTPSSRQVIPELRCGEVNGGFYMLHCNARTRHTKSNFGDLFVRCMVDKRSPPLLQSNFWVPSWGNYKAGDRWESRLRVVSSKLAEGSIPLRCFWQQVLREEQANVFLACSLWGQFDRLDGSVQVPFFAGWTAGKANIFGFSIFVETIPQTPIVVSELLLLTWWLTCFGRPSQRWMAFLRTPPTAKLWHKQTEGNIQCTQWNQACWCQIKLADGIVFFSPWEDQFHLNRGLQHRLGAFPQEPFSALQESMDRFTVQGIPWLHQNPNQTGAPGRGLWSPMGRTLGPLDLRILMANFLPVDSQTFQGDDLLLVSSQVCIQATIPDYQCIWGTPATDKEAYTLTFFIDSCDDLCLVLLSRCFSFHLGLDARLVNLCIKIGWTWESFCEC